MAVGESLVSFTKEIKTKAKISIHPSYRSNFEKDLLYFGSTFDPQLTDTPKQPQSLKQDVPGKTKE